MKQMSFKQYRAMDLVFFTLILAVSQLIITFAASRWFADQLYVVSPVAAVTAIVMMRWDLFALIPAAAGGVVLSLISGGSWKHILIYSVGNLLSLAALALLKRLGKQEVQGSTKLALFFAAAVQVLMLIGRMLTALVAGYGFFESLAFMTTDILSIVFTLVLVWIARRVDGLFEDQKHYLRRIQNEE